MSTEEDTKVAAPPTTEESPGPETKKPKMSTSVEESPDSEWPEAWYLPDEVTDQCSPNHLEPNKPVGAAALKALGIAYWKMDADSFKYPDKGGSSLLFSWPQLLFL